jgi:glucose-6-phosphate isomerase
MRWSLPSAVGAIAVAKLNTEQRKKLDESAFAFPKEEKEPLENASHVRNAIARFNQVKGVSDSERDAAWKRIKSAAKKFDVEVTEKSWREIGKD